MDKLVIAGVGLIGGSIGLAAKKRNAARQVVGTGRRKETLEAARAMGCIDDWSLSVEEAADGADLAVVCTTVSTIPEWAAKLARSIRDDAVLTDVGSTKGVLVRKVEKAIPSPSRFVGSHPIAGSEKTSAAHARADLFENRLTILTPTDHTSSETIDRVEAFWRALGSRTMRTDPETHDELMAACSHLPHLVAALVANRVADIPPIESSPVGGNGFKDVTRIAMGSPEVWVDILFDNREAILKELSAMGQSIEGLSEALETSDRDGLLQFLEQARSFRARLDEPEQGGERS